AASNGPLAIVETGDRVVLDLNTGRLDLLLDDAEIAQRRSALEAAGGYKYPDHQTPWQEIQRGIVGELETGAVLESAVKYQRIAQTKGIPRDNHCRGGTAMPDTLPKTAANYVALSPVGFLRKAAEVYPDRPAVVYGGIRRNWAETAARCR